MRTLALIALQAALAATVAGCAGGPNTTATEDQRLRSQCEARGGILVPSGANTGRPQIDQVCRIN